MIWCGSHPGKIKWAQLKKELVLQPWESAKRVEFRWCIAWCVFHGDKLVMEDGGKLELAFIHSKLGVLVGSADPYQAGSDIESRNHASEKDKAFFNALWERQSQTA